MPIFNDFLKDLSVSKFHNYFICVYTHYRLYLKMGKYHFSQVFPSVSHKAEVAFFASLLFPFKNNALPLSMIDLDLYQVQKEVKRLLLQTNVILHRTDITEVNKRVNQKKFGFKIQRHIFTWMQIIFAKCFFFLLF